MFWFPFSLRISNPSYGQNEGCAILNHRQGQLSRLFLHKLFAILSSLARVSRSSPNAQMLRWPGSMSLICSWSRTPKLVFNKRWFTNSLWKMRSSQLTLFTLFDKRILVKSRSLPGPFWRCRLICFVRPPIVTSDQGSYSWLQVMWYPPRSDKGRSLCRVWASICAMLRWDNWDR